MIQEILSYIEPLASVWKEVATIIFLIAFGFWVVVPMMNKHLEAVLIFFGGSSNGSGQVANLGIKRSICYHVLVAIGLFLILVTFKVGWEQLLSIDFNNAFFAASLSVIAVRGIALKDAIVFISTRRVFINDIITWDDNEKRGKVIDADLSTVYVTGERYGKKAMAVPIKKILQGDADLYDEMGPGFNEPPFIFDVTKADVANLRAWRKDVGERLSRLSRVDAYRCRIQGANLRVAYKILHCDHKARDRINSYVSEVVYDSAKKNDVPLINID